MPLIVEKLDTRIHSRNDFHNKITNIDKFLKERANKEYEQSISDTFVVVADSERHKILGYFTLSNSAIILGEVPATLSKKLAKYPSYGTVLLGRMGRDHNLTPRGFGKIIMKEAMKESLNRGTFYALELHAKESVDDKLIRYYLEWGFIQLNSDKHHLIMPRKTMLDCVAG